MFKKATAPDGPLVTYALIAACCLLFLLSPAAGLAPPDGDRAELLRARQEHFARWGVVPAELWAGPVRAALTPLTALFVHGTWLHLLGNMLFLQVFGSLAEARMGRLRFLACYLAAGYLALVGFAVAHADSTQPLVGASGAISGVLGAFLFLLPRARVTSLFPFLFFLPLRFPAWLVLPLWCALQWLAARHSGPRPGVAYLAHLIGFGVGFLYALLRWRGRTGPGAGSGPPARVKEPVQATEGDSQP
ncbi:rhomboid family intramembrane serine protease [Streptomyces buecherae]|uniref:Rhomboid family intramembrane serine protease n=1 Tax=Streptomyces buecherae TaxID=2763006 RepID=A0A7H8N4L9_9ACTN|nr:rhomboid family intramembrane serine protease [Streptomyces buecherae]QKW49454.1 rhomboid family intramembrane serine protease [Streptomyces buecherae]